MPFGESEEFFHRALELSPEERNARLAEWCGGDTRLLGEVSSLLAAYQTSDVAPPADPWIGRTVGAYRIEQVLGRGGTGAVYLAARNDGEFHMQAAIKVLANRLAGSAVRNRFELERQILASLDHPGIARLIDGGVTPEGEAYLVMEYVEGEPFDVWAARVRPGVRELVRVFLEVLSAVEYAHRNLILHRDLKPANILVTSAGQPKVLDFGNAAQADTAKTEEARRFTADFAAPEQVLGGAVSASCDVYSLGVVLYGILAGRPPYRFETQSSSEFVQVLRDFDPPPPGAPGDLDAIVMKAMAKEQGRRYSTIATFAADLNAYLEARPVSARAATAGYRLRRLLVRRRKALAAAGVAATLVLAAVGATEWQARRARAEERRAYAQMRDARELAHALLFDFYNAVQEVPGSLDVQRDLVNESIRYVDRIWSESPGDPEAARDMIEAYLRLANLQGNPYSDNLSDPDAALRTLAKARELAVPLGSARLLGLTEQGTGEVLYGKREIAPAIAHLEAAVERLETAAGLHNAGAGALLEAASACGVLGDVLSGGNGGAAQVARAQALFQRQLELDKRALVTEPENERAARGVAIAGMKLARLIAEERPAEAVRLLEAAVQQLGTLPDAARHNMSNLRLEAMLRTRLAGVLPSIGSYEAGQEHARQAVRLYESAAALAPGNARAQSDLLQAWYTFAESLDYRPAEMEEARKSYRAALAICRELMEAAPDNMLWKARAAELEFRIGRLSVALHDDAGAGVALKRARELAVKTADAADAGESELLRAAIQFSSEQVPAAWRDLPRARRYMERLTAEVSSLSAHQLATLAAINRLDGRLDEAASLIARAEALLPLAGMGQPKSYLRRQVEDERQAIRTAAARPALRIRSTPQK
jgi:predicted Ser/Thr protein kinase